MADPRLPDADPRIPEQDADEARLPDDLDQTPATGPSPDLVTGHGSEDAKLLAGVAGLEGDVGAAEAAPTEGGPDDLKVND